MRILPNRDVYENEDTRKVISEEQHQEFILKHIDFRRDTGILVYYEGAEYPKKGGAEPEALFAINIMKKILVHPTKLLLNWEFYPSILLFLLKTKNGKANFLNKVLNVYNAISERAIDGVIIKRCYMTPTAKALDMLVYKTLLYIGVDEAISNKFARYFACLLEFDDAYRYRFQDVMTEINEVDLFKNPAKEFIRILKIYKSRDREDTSSKMAILEPAIHILFRLSWFKKAFMSALKDINIKDMKLDVTDIYWTNMRIDYKFRGLTHEERTKEIKSFPKRVLRTNNRLFNQ